MSFIDVVILVITVIIIFLIVFFSFVFPKLKGQKIVCQNCPASKKGKRLLKDYKQKY